MNRMKGEIAELPVTARIHQIRAVLQRELRMREYVLKGSDKQRKVEEIRECMTHLDEIEKQMRAGA